jgi:DNA-binding MltR family transcriptional regulator
MTKQQQQQATERDDTQEIQRGAYLEKVSELDKAWKELDDERNIVGRLDREVARLKDENVKQEQINQNLLKSFQDLYSIYSQLYDQVISSNTALTITTGKLAESLVRFKFIIPQQEQPLP